MALVLSRKLKESILVAGPCKITVVDIDRGKVKLAIEADTSVRIDRSEVADKRRCRTEAVTEVSGLTD